MNKQRHDLKDASTILREQERAHRDALDPASALRFAGSAVEQLRDDNTVFELALSNPHRDPNIERAWKFVAPGMLRALSRARATENDQEESNPPRTKNTRRRPVDEAVAKALKKLGFAESEAAYSFKEIAGLAAPHMPKPPTTPEANLALEKAIARYYRRRAGAIGK